MADSPHSPNSNGDPGVESDRESITPTPRWVKLFGIVALVLVLLFVFLHLTGGGLRGHTPPFRLPEHGGQQP